MPNISKIVQRIPKMSDEELLNLFKNAVRMLSNSANAEAESVLAAVAKEWKLELDGAVAGQFFTERPTKGMLHELGYRVGQEGEKTPIRRQILKRVIELELPLVSSPAYTHEWGTPNSSKRYWKLTRFLEGQLSNPAYREMEKAMIEWFEDLEWVKKTYAHLAS